MGVYSQCEKNAGLYTALNLDKVFNLSAQADHLVSCFMKLFLSMFQLVVGCGLGRSKGHV